MRARGGSIERCRAYSVAGVAMVMLSTELQTEWRRSAVLSDSTDRFEHIQLGNTPMNFTTLPVPEHLNILRDEGQVRGVNQ